MRRRPKNLFCAIAMLFLFTYIFSSYFVIYVRDELILDGVLDTISKFMYPDNISCYLTSKNDSLISADDRKFLYNTIFFHETSCGISIKVRHACSIESAARTHPNRKISVLFTKSLPVSSYDGVLGELLKFSNIELSRVHIEEYAKRTPFEKDFKKTWFRGKRRYKRIAELLKFITLYKFGGTFVDLDMIIARSLDVLGRDWVAKETEDVIGSEILSLTKSELGEPLIRSMLRYLRKQIYYHEIRGSRATTEALQELCSTHVRNMTFETCRGLRVYSSELFYPYNSSNWNLYFEPGELNEIVFAYNTWSDWIRVKTIPRNSMYATLAQEYCPTIFSKYMYLYLS